MKFTIIEEQYAQMLRFLEQLQMCYELTEREVAHYGQGGYLFTSLRPRADVLHIPLDPQDHQVSIGSLVCRQGREYACHSCRTWWNEFICDIKVSQPPPSPSDLQVRKPGVLYT